MKRRKFLLLIGLFIIILLTACSKAKDTGELSIEETTKDNQRILRVGATPVPHSEILEFVSPILLKEGIKLEIIEFTDYTTPNLALAEASIDANFFQHVPYMETFAENNGLNLAAATKVHVEPLGLYSKKITHIQDLKEGARIAIPNDPTNGGRALLLLEYYGLIKLKEDAPLTATEKDIIYNPKNLRFVSLEAPQLPRSLDDVDASVINTNYALEAGFNPAKDALILEDANSPYANVLTVRPEDLKNEEILALISALNSPEVKEFIDTKYQGAIVPAF